MDAEARPYDWCSLMRPLFSQALRVMEQAFRLLEQSVPPPVEKPWRDGFVLRYIDETVHQALVQKLARVISGLHAADLLLSAGFVQEQSVIHRTLDEINEDIMFLVAAITNDTITDLHRQYLASFWAEEFSDPDNVLGSAHGGRNLVPRKKIRAYLARLTGADDVSAHTHSAALIGNAYSGYVHAASPHIMDMCFGTPPRFHVGGMPGTARAAEHADDAWNYVYRSLLSVVAVAKAFGAAKLVTQPMEYVDRFEMQSGTTYFDDLRSGR